MVMARIIKTTKVQQITIQDTLVKQLQWANY